MYKIFRIDTKSQPRRRLLSAATALPATWVQEYYKGVEMGGPLRGSGFYCFEKFKDADHFAFSRFIDRALYQYELWEVEAGGEMWQPECIASLSSLNGTIDATMPTTSGVLRIFWEQHDGLYWPERYVEYFIPPPEGTWLVERLKPLRRIYRVYRPTLGQEWQCI